VKVAAAVVGVVLTLGVTRALAEYVIDDEQPTRLIPVLFMFGASVFTAWLAVSGLYS
jgi:hypothetical protein